MHKGVIFALDMNKWRGGGEVFDVGWKHHCLPARSRTGRIGQQGVDKAIGVRAGDEDDEHEFGQPVMAGLAEQSWHRTPRLCVQRRRSLSSCGQEAWSGRSQVRRGKDIGTVSDTRGDQASKGYALWPGELPLPPQGVVAGFALARCEGRLVAAHGALSGHQVRQITLCRQCRRAQEDQGQIPSTRAQEHKR